MRFWLGTHRPNWLAVEPDLFVSRRTLTGRKSFPIAVGEWALDSGGFTELNLFGEWRTTVDEYVADVLLFEREVGNLAWVAPMDWMCEPHVLEKTGLSVGQHQRRTIENFLRLRDELGMLVIPVLQGWTVDDYLWCWWEYDRLGIRLDEEPLVGLGSVCRRQNVAEAGSIVRSLSHLPLHYFGAKKTGLQSFGDALVSADSMAWSVDARLRAFKGYAPLFNCHHKSCQNCIRYARWWRSSLNDILGQERLVFA